MYEGYLRLGDVEIANASRTEAYVRNLLPGFPLRGCNGDPAIPAALGEEYNSPLQDQVSWIDPSNPATYGFLGFYPIAVEGMEDSTTIAEVTQSLTSGGYVNSPREATREIRVRGILVGKDELAVRAGFTWLDRALAQSRCIDDPACHGATLDYFAAVPEIGVCYTDIVNGYNDVRSGLTPGSLVSGGSTINEDGLYRGTFAGIEGWDGLTWTWGVSRFTGDLDDFMEDPEVVSGPVTPYRTNKVRNPQFSVNTGLWGTDGALARQATGGPTGGTFGRLNFINGLWHLQTALTDAISGPNMLQFQSRTTLPTFTVNIRSTVDNSLLQTQTFTGSSTWQLYSLALPTAVSALLEFEVGATGAHSFDVTNVLVEAATQLLPYFDGDTLPAMQPSHAADAPVPEYAVEWLGIANQSASRMRWLGEATYEFCGEGKYAWLSVQSGRGSVRVSVAHSFPIPAAQQAHPYTRFMRDVSRTSGPIKQQQFYTSQGASMMVEFLLTAATPYAYNKGPWSYVTTLVSPLSFTDTTPPEPPPAVIIDPDCPPVPAPPRPPIIDGSCVVTPGTWDRYSFIVPDEQVSRWSATLPTVSVHSGPLDLRQLRVRAYRNPLGVALRRLNRAPRPYPESAGGWVSASAPSFPVTTDTFNTRRVGSKVSVVTRTTTALDSRIAAWTYVGASGTAMANLADVTGVTQDVQVSAYFMTRNAPDARYAFTVYWYTAAGALLRTDVQTPQTTISGNDRYTRVSYSTPTPPLTAARLRVDVTFYTASGSNATGDEIVYLQDVQVEDSIDPTPYFDGAGEKAPNFTFAITYPEDYNLVYSWAGTAFNSASIAQIDPFGFESEFIVSYMPAESNLVVDSTVQRSDVFLPNPDIGPVYVPTPISAANLLYGQDGGPMSWPEFTCGVPYTITVDVPPGEGDDVIVGMELTRRE